MCTTTKVLGVTAPLVNETERLEVGFSGPGPASSGRTMFRGALAQSTPMTAVRVHLAHYQLAAR